MSEKWEMVNTYSDQYIFSSEDPRMTSYFRGLPGYIQSEILNRKRRPATYEELLEAEREVRKIF